MLDFPINYYAILGAIVWNMALGMLWYSFLFKKPWMKYSGMTAKAMKSMKISPWMAMGIMLGIVIVVTLVHSYYIIIAGALTVAEGLHASFVAWLGFVACPIGSIYLFTGKSIKLWLIDAGYWLVGLLGMGAILAVWL